MTTQKKLPSRHPSLSLVPSVRQVIGVEVQKLFGQYNYTLGLASGLSKCPLMILYGENGSGKTTILNLLFHILACEEGQGHKTYVAKTSFQSFKIHFSDKMTVIASRPEGKYLGTFTINVLVSGKEKDSCSFTADHNHVVKKDSGDGTSDFLSRFRKFGMTLYFLSDGRIVKHSSFVRPRGFPRLEFDLSDPQEGMDLVWSDNDVFLPAQHRRIEPQEIQARLLEASMNVANNYIRSRARVSASEGESNSAGIYRSIVLGLTKSGAHSNKLEPETIAAQLGEISEINKKFEKYGFLPPYDHEPMITAISSLGNSKQDKGGISQIGAILNPYIEGIKAKHTALSQLQEFLDRLVTSLNKDFLRGKNISFEVSEGFKVRSLKDASEISPENLSSGERHLLLIFMNAVNSLEKPTIFIIDEPEISLNVKWQRRLVETLLACIDQEKSQYILATHSIELLTEHSSAVVALEDQAHATL